MMRLGMWLSLVLLAGSMFDCGGLVIDEPAQELAYESFEEAQHFAVLEPGVQVIRSEAVWTALWEETGNLYDDSGEKAPAPDVDFSQHMIIAIFWGDGYSGCSSGVEAVEAVWLRDNEIEVRVGPLPDLGPCDALVYPVQMLRVAASNRSVIFRGEVPGK